MKSFLWLLLISLFINLALVTLQNNTFLYIQHSLQLREYSTPVLALLLGCSVLFLPVWKWLTNRYGKKTVLVLGILISGYPANLGFYLLPEGELLPLVLVSIIGGAGVANLTLLPETMIPDVTDEDTLATGRTREGVFYSAHVFFQKTGAGIALAVSNFALDTAGKN